MMCNRYNSILETIGNTPVVKINNIGPAGVNIYAKVESFNPMGSVKDRLALGVIEEAERCGELKPGQTIIEATSGNTGIGLAMVCAQKGYPLVITMAENFSVERRKMMRFLGAKVVLTPASDKGTGVVKKAAELAAKHGWWQSLQFENPANADIHARTTAIEILEDFSDIPLHYWVSGFGSGGTLNGVARVLKAKSPNTRVMVCEPDNSQMLATSIPQPRNPDGSESKSHPGFRPHLLQGVSPDFIPKLAEQSLNASNIDGFLPIDGKFALQCAKDLAQKEGIFVGISSGATLAGALKLAETVPEGSNILCMLPDTGERYMSTPLFEEIAIEMNAEEQRISRSTQGYRFDLSASTEAEDDDSVAVDPAAMAEMETLIHNNHGEIVMFALEWCEFCWSVRKVLDRYEIPYKSIDLDSVEYLGNNRGGKIRAALRRKTTWNTFPQLFINDEFLGGCSDLFDGCKDGTLPERLDSLGIPRNPSVELDPYELLPSWLHPR
jgi:cysteine synthase A